MANLIAVANGNLSSASTWGLCDTTSANDTEASSVLLTTSFADSTAFTPGAITVDGVAVKFRQVNNIPTGTLILTLRNSTGAVDVSTVTINVSDIPASVQGNNGGWVFFKFASSVTLIAATAYTIRMRTTNASQILAYMASGTNWARLLRTTTTQAPAAGDQMIIAGEYTAAATVTARTVTMDSTSMATSYGNLNVCLGGTLTWGSSASTAYQLSLTGLLNVYPGATYNMGTTGTPIPSTSSAELLFNCGSNVQYGFEIYGGTVNIYGNAPTKSWDFLNADASAAATSLTTLSSTGWLSGQTVCIAPTTRTPSQVETKALSGNATGTTVPIAALTNAHGGGGTTNVVAEIGLLDRNVKIHGVSVTLQSYINIRSCAVIAWDSVEVYWMGSATANKVGVSVAGVTLFSTSMFFNRCSFHDFQVTGSKITFQSYLNVAGTFTFTNNVVYWMDSGTVMAGSGTVHDVETNMILKSVTSSSVIGFQMNFGNAASVYKNNVVSGHLTSGANSLQCAAYLSSTVPIPDGSFDGNIFHTNAAAGLTLGSSLSGTLTNGKHWRNGGSFGGPMTFSTYNFDCTFKGWTLFGNFTYNCAMGEGRVRFINCTFNSDSTFTTSYGITTIQTNSSYIVEFDSCQFSNVVAHANNDLTWQGLALITARNTTFGAATPFFIAGNYGSYAKEEKAGGVSGTNKTSFVNGVVSRDATIYDTVPSQRLTGNTTATNAFRLRSGPIRVPVASGQTVTINVKVRQSVVGDGTAYTGSFPRLILEVNGALGVTDDTVGATASAAGQGAWETLTYTSPTASEDGVFTFYVDCTGAVGWVNVDTITVT